jgi:hypothetical protein
MSDKKPIITRKEEYDKVNECYDSTTEYHWHGRGPRTPDKLVALLIPLIDYIKDNVLERELDEECETLDIQIGGTWTNVDHSFTVYVDQLPNEVANLVVKLDK